MDKSYFKRVFNLLNRQFYPSVATRVMRKKIELGLLPKYFYLLLDQEIKKRYKQIHKQTVVKKTNE